MPVLTEDEVRFFKREGYLVKKGALDPELCARARERLWDDPPPSLKKDDPDSWVGPIKPEEESMDKSNYKRGYRWQYRKVGREPGWLSCWQRIRLCGVLRSRCWVRGIFQSLQVCAVFIVRCPMAMSRANRVICMWMPMRSILLWWAISIMCPKMAAVLRCGPGAIARFFSITRRAISGSHCPGWRSIGRRFNLVTRIHIRRMANPVILFFGITVSGIWRLPIIRGRSERRCCTISS